MTKKLTCIECPRGCLLSVEIEEGEVSKVSGSGCPKGEIYAKSEIENPLRVLTSTVLTEGLSLKIVPVRTDNPIPRRTLFEAMKEIKKLKIYKPVRTGDIIVKNFLNLGVNLIATRESFKE